MNHSFNTKIAKEIGIAPAVLFENIAFWIMKNEANQSNFFDGDYWTFSSVEGFSKLFDYLTQKQIRTALQKLVDTGYLKTGNYNNSPYDRTKWYALTAKSRSFFAISNSQKEQIDLPKKANEIDREGEPIPYINTDIGTDIDKDTTTDVVVVANDVDDAPAAATKSSKKPACPHQDIINLYHEILPMCPRIKAWTPARASALRARWNEEKKRQNLDYWRAFFEYVASCDFLTGKVSGSRGRPFIASLDWMLKAENFTKIREERYDNDR